MGDRGRPAGLSGGAAPGNAGFDPRYREDRAVLQLPATFTLRDPARGRAAALLAVGMTLPDGDALTVDWRTGQAGGVSVWPSPDAAAAAHRAQLVWYGRSAVPVPPAGPPNARLWRWAS